MDGYHVHLIIVSDSGHQSPGRFSSCKPSHECVLKCMFPSRLAGPTNQPRVAPWERSRNALSVGSGWVGNRGIVTSATDRYLALFRDKSWRDIHVTKTAVNWRQVNHVAHSLFFTTETKARARLHTHTRTHARTHAHTHTRARERRQNKTRKKKQQLE